ncbi:MAG: GAF domain-containing SpoIIE family protein phosphatase [Phycisphaerae bacterium]|nr:GAF domain-containing SpoIIE family protein phosphatase [Phycisphaerae bacterium]
MLRALLDIAWLEDFLAGAARGRGLRFAAYDRHGVLVAAGDPVVELTALAEQALARVPADIRFQRLAPADEPPAEVAFIADQGIYHVVAPVYVEEQLAGFVAVGEFRGEDLAPQQKLAYLEKLQTTPAEVERLWRELPLLERRGDWHAVRTVRWLARMLGAWVRREQQVVTSSDELSVVGDMAELLHGDEDLQTVLNRVVSETARVMKCRFCSLRLLDAQTGELRMAATHNLPPAYLDKGSVYPGDNPIDQEALAGKIIYVEDAAADPRVRFPDAARRAGIVSGLTVGLIYRGQALGVIRVYTDRKQRFRTAQRKLLRAIAYQAATAIAHARLFEERLQSARTQRQLELAGDLQTRLMRTTPPMKPHIRVASLFQPSQEVGGDFCDFVLLADGRLAAVVADVVGKGIKASLLATYLRGALRAAADHTGNIAEMVTRLNRQFCHDTLPAEFVTLLIAAIREDGRELEYCNAGHEPVLRLRAGEVTVTKHGGLVLGVNPEERYATSTVDLQPDDVCLLYTDGAIEAFNFESESYGRRRLTDSLRRHGGLEISTALRSVQWDIRRFAGLAEQGDDLTLVGIRVVD